jgi:hypothetical protein
VQARWQATEHQVDWQRGCHLREDGALEVIWQQQQLLHGLVRVSRMRIIVQIINPGRLIGIR